MHRLQIICTLLLCISLTFNSVQFYGILNYWMPIIISLVVIAFVGTVGVFACFTAAAMLAKRRSYLYLGGTLMSMMSLMMFLMIVNWIIPRFSDIIFKQIDDLFTYCTAR